MKLECDDPTKVAGSSTSSLVGALRLQRGLSVETLANLCHMSASDVACLEDGSLSPSAKQVHDLAQALSVSPSVILGLSTPGH